MEEELPFWEMEPADELVSGGGTIELGIGKGKKIPLGPQVFVKRGEVYAVYLPTATPSGTLDLTGLMGDAELRWFNPRSGAFAGQKRQIRGGGPVELGAAPADPEQDWVVLVKRTQKSAGLPGPHEIQRRSEFSGPALGNAIAGGSRFE